MLDLSKSHCVSSLNTYTSFFCVIFLLFSNFIVLESHQEHPHEYEWVNRYFNSLDDEASLGEVVDLMLCLRTSLIDKGHEVPTLAEMCLQLTNQLVEQGVDLDEEFVESIYDEILLREGDEFIFSQTLNHHPQSKIWKIQNKKKKELNISGDFAIGFCKALGGSLLCIIPHPATIAIGSGLVLSGVNDMIQSAGDPADNEHGFENQQKNLPRRID